MLEDGLLCNPTPCKEQTSQMSNAQLIENVVTVVACHTGTSSLSKQPMNDKI